MNTTFSEAIEQIFEVTQPASLVLGNIRGSVTISPGAGDRIEVKAVKHTDRGDAERTQIFLEQDPDGLVRVETRYDHLGLGSLLGDKPCKVDYTVRVPASCQLRVSGVSNSTTITGVSGRLDIGTVSGDLRLEDLGGEFHINMVSGDLFARNLNGPLWLDTVSGDAVLDGCTLPRISCGTVSGDLIFQTDLGEGPYHLKSVSGDVHLALRTVTPCTVRSDSLSGSVKCTLPVTRSEQHSRHSLLEIQGGGTQINHNSVSGDLWLENPGERPLVRPRKEDATSQPEAPDHSQLLERIERGEISVDEALQLLQA